MRKFGKNKKGLSTLVTVILIIIVVVVIVAIASIAYIHLVWAPNVWDGLVDKDEDATQAWADFQVQLQRRYELIPNLINIARDYKEFFKDLINNTVYWNNHWLNLQTQGASETEMVEAANQIESLIGDMFVVAYQVTQAYPDDENVRDMYIQLMDEWIGSQDMIADSLEAYNEAVAEYNKIARGYWNGWIMDMKGWRDEYPVREKFEALAIAQQAPVYPPP